MARRKKNPTDGQQIEESFVSPGHGRFADIEWVIYGSPMEVWHLQVAIKPGNRFAPLGNTSFRHLSYARKGRGLTRENFKSIAGFSHGKMDLDSGQLSLTDADLRRIGVREYMIAQEMATRMIKLLRKA